MERRDNGEKGEWREGKMERRNEYKGYWVKISKGTWDNGKTGKLLDEITGRQDNGRMGQWVDRTIGRRDN